MTNRTSVMYLDFDGVFNAKEPLHDEVSQFTITVEGSVNFKADNHITFAPQVVNIIESFRESHNTDLTWLTSWNEKERVLHLSHHLGGLHGGRVLPASLHTEQVGRKEWTAWKAHALVEDQKVNPKPFIWVDDHAHEHWGEFVKDETVAPSLLITPTSLHGLTLEELVLMDEFLRTSEFA